MNKKNLINILAIITLSFVLIGLTFFKKEGDGITPGNNKETETTEGEKVEIENEKERRVSPKAIEKEQEDGQLFIESFVAAHESYVYGDFSGTESLYYMMTEEFKAEETTRIMKLREMTASQNHITVEAEVISSDISYFDYETKELSMRVLIRSNFYNGVVISNPTQDNKDATKIIGADGTEYQGNFQDLLYTTEEESLEIVAIKQENGWKISDSITISIIE